MIDLFCAPLSHLSRQVTYDLHQVDPSHLLPLRDTLITALESYKSGPKTIITQLCLALSGFALQLPAWENALQTMVETFGTNPATVPVLLQFLTVLPEEVSGNTRIPVTVSGGTSRCCCETFMTPTGRRISRKV